LSTGLNILLALISFFFLFSFLSFKNDRSENNYITIRWTNFRNLFTEWMFWVQMINLDLFFSRDVAMATNFVKK